MRGRAIVVAVALLFPSVVVSQTAGKSSPTQVARDFFTAWSDGRWLDAARMLDLRNFEAYRQNIVRIARSRRSVTAPTPEQVMMQQPEMPRVVAEYVSGKASQAADSDNVSMVFARTPSGDALAALPLEEAAARWLEARDPRWQAERSIAHLGPRCLRPPLSDIVKPPPSQALGEVLDHPSPPGGPDTLSYVLFREPPDPRNPVELQPGVLTLTLVSGRWKITPLPEYGLPGGVNRYTIYGCMMVAAPPSK